MTDFAIDVAVSAERSAPGATASVVKTYTRDVAGVTQQFAKLSNGTEVQLTPVVLTAGSVTPAMCETAITFGPRTLVDQAAHQNVFTNSTITLSAGVTYKFRGKYVVDTTIATTSSLTSSISFGGTATFTSFAYNALMMSFSGIPGLANTHWTYSETAGSTIVSGASQDARRLLEFEGIMVVNTGGTLITRLGFSAATGRTPVVTRDSYFELIPLGAGFAQQGGWG